MSRFFIDQTSISGNKIFITEKNDIKHILKVLRLGEGSTIEISDSQEFEYKVEISSIEEGVIEAVILEKQRFVREPSLEITLYQGIPKQGKMEFIIQKCVELGVRRIIPVFTERTVVTDKGNFKNKLARWQKISDEAVKQCRRGIIPPIENPIDSRKMVEDIKNQYDLILFLYENEEKRTIKDVFRSISGKIRSVALIIGPEGGFSGQEVALITESGAKSASLGKTILRTETAGAAAIAMVMYELEL